MTIYERLAKIRDTYKTNAMACSMEGLCAAHQIIKAQAEILTDYINDMPVEIANMYAGENE